jgi:hypothetical protein
MNDEVPGYGQSTKTMNSLLTHRDYVQTGTNGKVQDCGQLFEDASLQDETLSVPATLKTKTTARAVNAPVPMLEKPAPVRKTFSQFKSTFRPVVSNATSSATREKGTFELPAGSTDPTSTHAVREKFSMSSFSSLRSGSIRRR